MQYELYHHGIHGQKWGIRRFQKTNRALTTAGKKRYNDNGSLHQKARNNKSPGRLEKEIVNGLKVGSGIFAYTRLRRVGHSPLVSAGKMFVSTHSGGAVSNVVLGITDSLVLSVATGKKFVHTLRS